MKRILAFMFALVSSVGYASTQPTYGDDRTGRITYDIGVSSGGNNGSNYTEANLGINWWFHNAFAWRNSLFGRFQTDVDTVYGLDTSVRGSHTFELAEAVSMNVFAGPGWRFASEGNNAPIAEGGLVFRLGGLSIGGGAKAIFHEVVDKNLENDVQYFIVLGGGGVLR